MRTASDELFQLLKSLSKQEKRYFKLYAARHVIGEQNKYLLLFDAIDKQTEYDEVRIKEQFKNEAFTRQLHVIKNYLYNLIMKSMRNFHSNNTDDRFHDLLRDAQILYDKGLHKQSSKVLDKARKFAEDNEQFLQLLEIQNWQHTIIHQNNDVNKLQEYVSGQIQVEIDLLDKYRNFLQFQLLNDRIFTHYWKSGIVRNQKEKDEMARMFSEELYKNPENAASFEAKFFYYNALFTFYYCTGDLINAYETVNQLVLMIESIDPGLKRNTSKYISSLNNQYAIQKELKEYAESLITLKKIRSVKATSLTQKVELFMRSYTLELDLYITTGQFNKALNILPEVMNQFKKYVRMIDKQSKLAFNYNFSYIYFGAGDYGEALTWNNHLLNDSDIHLREDIHCFARILNLIIHYELGNDQLLEHIAKSTYRYLYKRKRLFKVETVILNFIKRNPNWIDKKRMTENFKGLFNDLIKLEEDPFEKHAFEYFDFISWLDSKINGSAFQEIKSLKAK